MDVSWACFWKLIMWVRNECPCSGRLFQATDPATQNARLPSCSLVLDTTKSPRAAERRAEKLFIYSTEKNILTACINWFCNWTNHLELSIFVSVCNWPIKTRGSMQADIPSTLTTSQALPSLGFVTTKTVLSGFPFKGTNANFPHRSSDVTFTPYSASAGNAVCRFALGSCQVAPTSTCTLSK